MTTAVVTGIGAITANGPGTDAWWRATLAGVTGIKAITSFDASRYPVRVAGQIDDLDPRALIPPMLIAQTDRWTQLALAATTWALADARLDPADLPAASVGVVTASSSGGNVFGQREIGKLWRRGPAAVSAYQSIAWFYAASTGQVSIANAVKGPCGVLVSEQAGGLDAIGHARRLLRADDAHAVLVGGTEAPLGPYALVCQLASGRLSAAPDPARAYQPFDVHAQGHVPGEGGAMLVLERAATARARGARVYGAVAGYAATFDPAPRAVGGAEASSGLCRAVRLALRDARVSPAQVDVVFADAAAVPALDKAEAAVIAGVFGPGAVPVTAPKTMAGRLNSGGGALDVAGALLALRDQLIPPTVGTTRVDPGCPVDLVMGAPREAILRTALVLARGDGGFNAAVVVQGI